MLDLQKITLKRLLTDQDNNFYSKLLPEYFTGTNNKLYKKIESFYNRNIRLPNIDEFSVISKDQDDQDYFESEICNQSNPENIADEFLVSQLQDYHVREDTIDFLNNFIDELSDLEKTEIVDRLQNVLLDLHGSVKDEEEFFDAGELETFPDKDKFTLYPSGLSTHFDAINGGFSTEELVLLGGRRGSGKSIISLNMAINRFLEGSTVAFFSIEMRYIEVYSRLLSIISGVPFLDIYRDTLSIPQREEIYKAKIDFFYENNEEIKQKLAETSNLSEFDVWLKGQKLKNKRFFIIDSESLSISKIDHYCNIVKNKYEDFTLSVVDYLNIVKIQDSKDWKSQITIAEHLKSMARKYNITLISPYQIDASGEARYAKGILDAADRSFTFYPPEEDEDGEQSNKIKIHTTKMRNGKLMNFDVHMNWTCVRLDPDNSETITEGPLPIAKYGDDSRDV